MPKTRRAAMAAAMSLFALAFGFTARTQNEASASVLRPRVAPLATTTGLAKFGNPTISGIQGVGFEQDLRVDHHNRVYTSVPGSLSSATSWIWRSLDGGRTFKWIPASAPRTGKLPTCVGGGDTELAVDSADHLYFNDLTLANFSTGRSDDQGLTFNGGVSCTGVLTTPDDRQWYATQGDPTNGGNLYLNYDIVAGSPMCNGSVGNNELVMARSPLAGQGATAGVQFNPSENIACDEGIMGNNEVSPTTGHIFVIHDTANFDGIRIGVCQNVDFTVNPSGLSCTDKPVASFPGFRTGANFPTMAVDKSGNIYAVWEEGPVDAMGNVTGDTLLYFASSTDEGDHWTTHRIPTPGLHNNVFAWPAAGDNGKVDIAWYGTPGTVNIANPIVCSGPDSVNGLWSLYFTQTMNGHNATPSFSPLVVASNHFVHRGNIQTVEAGQCGDRTLGDFLQLRIGNQGEANISYADSNNIDEIFAPHGMFVRQNGGPSVFAASGPVHGDKFRRNLTTDPAGDATLDAAEQVGANQPNLDILASSVSKPDAGHFRFTMKVADLTSLSPPAGPDTTLVWQTQWLQPSTTDPNGGKNFMVYMESSGGGAPTFWIGQNAAQALGGGVTLTYPGDHQVAGSYTPGKPGVITIDVPAADIQVVGALDNRFYQVTASTQGLTEPAETVPSLGGIGGDYFDLFDVIQSYDFVPPYIKVSGHAHSDYNHNGSGGIGDVHIEAVNVADNTGTPAPPTGVFRYRDLRADPPGNAATGLFECRDGTPTSLEQLGSHTARISGTITCTGGLSGVASFVADVTDNGKNPPNTDAYHVVLKNADGVALYDWADNTSVGVGDLTVVIRAR